jgi:hypothetical protein
MSQIIDFLMVISLSSVKFIFGPALGFARGLPFWATVFGVVFGMMCTVVAFTYFGDYLKRRLLSKFVKQKRVFTKSNRFKVKIWRRYGIWGTAFLTPILFSPIVGTLLAVSFENRRVKVIYTMFISAVFWSFVLSFAIYFFVKDPLN